MKNLIVLIALLLLAMPAMGVSFWHGTISQYWNDAANWDPYGIPDADTDVWILAVSPSPVTTGTGTAECRDLYLEPGAALTVNSQPLQVYGAMEIAGAQLNLNYPNCAINVHGSMTWQNNSVLNMASTGFIYCYDDLILNSGSDFSMDQGSVIFKGGGESRLTNLSLNTQFHNLRNAKDAYSSLRISDDSYADFVVNGELRNDGYAYFYNNAAVDITLRGNLLDLSTGAPAWVG